MALPYEKLLSQRRQKTSDIAGRQIDEEAESDRGRVLFNAPFRRLQDKAQVFSLETNAAVRSRLTHSLEVASVGRRLANGVLGKLGTKGQLEGLGLEDPAYQRAFVGFVETSCLLHDIGNPPFGHFGEIAISDWFEKHHDKFEDMFFDKTPKTSHAKRLWPKLYTDFTRFDGNPQGLRIVSKLQWNRDKHGLNLTYTQLAAMVKYPVSPADLDSATPYSGPSRKKPGFFYSERELMSDVQKHLGLAPNQRHPIVYLMEAADDTCYCLSDIEDGAEKDVITIPEFARFIQAKKFAVQAVPELRDAFDALAEVERGNPSAFAFLKFRTSLTNHLVSTAISSFVENHDSMLMQHQGSEPRIFPKQSLENEILTAIKEFAITRLYESKLVRQREITAYAAICGLLDAHSCLLECSEERFARFVSNVLEKKSLEYPPLADQRRNSVEASLLSRMPKKHIRAYREAVSSLSDCDGTLRAVQEWWLRAHLLVDFVSGMTDKFAVQSYQVVSGVALD